MNSLAAAACGYAHIGFAVFPLLPREKKPATKHGFKEATKARATVHDWWTKKPACNVGLATGAVSGFWVLDLDGPEADEDLAALEARHGPLPPTLEQRTGKGRQLLFAWSTRWPAVRNLSKRSRERIGRAIDVRGDGGYIVAPPSIHPNGRAYAWAPGAAPGEAPIAEAPDWLMQLVIPAPEPERPSPPAAARTPIEGRASRYGEAALDRACREISAAREGTKNDTLWLNAIGIGRLRGGGEFADDAYALDALRAAGRQMCSWSPREESTLSRGFELGLAQPRSAPERGDRAPAPRPAAAESGRKPAAEIARAQTEAGTLWGEARTAFTPAAECWLIDRGLNPYALPDTLGRLMRVHPDGPWGDGRRGPALLAPLISDVTLRSPEGVAVLPLGPNCERFTHFIGETERRVLLVDSPAEPEGWLVAQDLQDAWALATAAREEEWRLLVLVAPRLSSFAGGPLGDRFGRVDPDMPLADPDARPFTSALGELPVQLAVRGDLRSPPLKLRKAMGGTHAVRLEGEAAARFYGGLAEQHWKAAGANRVRVLRPSGGAAGFNQSRGE